MTREEKLRSFILENFLFTSDGSQLRNDESFLKREILDSTGVLELIEFLQAEFGIKVLDSEMVPANLDSINNLLVFVEKKSAAV